MPPIESVEARAIRIPLRTTYHESEAAIDAFHHVIVEVNAGDHVGIGEADFLSLAQTSAEPVAFAVNQQVAPAITGMDAFDREGVLGTVHEVVVRTLGVEATGAAMSCIDLALWDLIGTMLGEPVYRFLGGRVTDTIDVSFTLSAESPAAMAQSAAEMVEFGYRTLVIKAGRGDLEVDEARAREVREAVGPEITLRLDINGGYPDLEVARARIEAVSPYDIEYVEQPLPRGLEAEMAALRSKVSVPIVADESLVTPEDAVELAERDAVDIFNIKPTKCGGLHRSAKIAAIAEAAGIPCLVGGHPQQEIARQASRHFAAAFDAVNCGYANEGPGPASQSLTDHVTTSIVTYDDVADFDGSVAVPETVGLGVELDRRALERYTTVEP